MSWKPLFVRVPGGDNWVYNFLGLQLFNVASSQPLAAGKATIRYEFVSDGPGMGKGGIGRIFVNGEKVAEGRIERTQCCFFSADEGADVGMDDGTPVTEDYKEGNNKFTGKINSVTIDLKETKAASTEEDQLVIHEAHVRKQLAD